MVSVIIPVYQVENYIKSCLESVVNQTYDKLEIIIVDDGSKDQSGKICDEYAKKDSRLTVIHKKNGGLMSAWLTGLQRAHGEWVFFVDSDDWVELDAIETLLSYAEKEKVDIIDIPYISHGVIILFYYVFVVISLFKVFLLGIILHQAFVVQIDVGGADTLWAVRFGKITVGCLQFIFAQR